MTEPPENVQLEIDPDDDLPTRNIKSLYNRLNEMEWRIGEAIDAAKAATARAGQLEAQVNESRSLLFVQRAELENRLTDQERKITDLERQLGGT